MSPTARLQPLLQTLRARFRPPLQHSFTEEQIRERAQVIWQERMGKGQSGTAEADWQQAIRVLKAAQRQEQRQEKQRQKREQRISAKAHQLWEARQLKLRESDKRTAVDDWRDAEARLKESGWTRFVRWTGVKEKRGWDFVQLLASISIPVVLFAGGSFFTYWNNQQQQQIAENRQQDEVLKNYFDSMKGLLLDDKHPLRQSKPKDESRSIARTLTLTALRQLDSIGGERKGLLIQFLYESGLIKADKKGAAVINLWGANLEGANLEGANLTSADISRADLTDANLSGAHLEGANLNLALLSYTNLTDANLTDANLISARLDDANLIGTVLYGVNLSFANLQGDDLSGANLRGVQGLTDNQLSDAKLCHTTMPDGTISNRECKGMGIKP